MPVGSEEQALLDEWVRQGARPYDQLGVLRARRGVENASGLQGERVEVPSVRDLLVPGPAGLLPVRVYDPDPAATSGLVVHFHGGGWVLGSVALADKPCRALAAATGRVVVSVEYRRPPETPFPGPVQDCYAVTSWCAAHAAELGADPARVAVLGDSAGGNLAAAVAMMARDRGGPALERQVLLYPTIDPRGDYPSLDANGVGFGVTRSEIDWYWSLYLAGAAPTPYAAPLLADLADLAGLPPATVVTAEYDPLRDEGHAYAERLAAAGVPTRVTCLDGTIHGLFWFGGWLRRTEDLMKLLADDLGD